LRDEEAINRLFMNYIDNVKPTPAPEGEEQVYGPGRGADERLMRSMREDRHPEAARRTSAARS